MHVGLIGARSFGKHHLEAMQASPHVQAVTLAGRNRAPLEALQAEFSKVRALSTDYQELLDDRSIDLLDIVLPHHLHLPVALAAFQRGKHVLVEKPPARTPEEFRQMQEAAQSAGRRLFVVMNLLYSPLHRAVREAVDRGAIGQPFLALEISVGNALKIYEDPENWRADRDRSGGGLQIDGGFHAVYRQLYYLESHGAPRWLTADCAQIGVREPQKGEDFAALTFSYEAGLRVHLMSQWTARAGLGRFPSGILGTEGSLVFTGEDAVPVVIRRPEADDEPVPVPEGPRAFHETVRVCVKHYLECLATGAAPHADVDLAGLTLEIITSGYRAAETGQRVELEGRFETRFPSNAS
jgi:predicted dehydrogenase